MRLLQILNALLLYVALSSGSKIRDAQEVAVAESRVSMLENGGFELHETKIHRKLQDSFVTVTTSPETVIGGVQMTLIIKFQRSGRGNTQINVNWKDGTTNSIVTVDSNSGTVEVSHVYSEGGTYEVLVTVKTLGRTTETVVVLPAGTSPAPTLAPSESPTAKPSVTPSKPPTESPTLTPSAKPSTAPSKSPTDAPSNAPTSSPSMNPTSSPTGAPTASPTSVPSNSPTDAPSVSPTGAPTTSPSSSPTGTPSTSPTVTPTVSPSASPTVTPGTPTATPSVAPSATPSAAPSTTPSVAPSLTPSASPSTSPSSTPTLVPTPRPTPISRPPVPPPTPGLTPEPSSAPTLTPTNAPSRAPTSSPTKEPTMMPSSSPSVSDDFGEGTQPLPPPTPPPTIGCPVVSVFPFTSQDGTNKLEGRGELGRVGYLYTAATQLAIDHFNQRNPVIVPELASLDCDVVFSDHVVLDSGMDENQVFEKLFHAIDLENPPCAMFGPALPAEIKAVSPFAFATETAQVSYLSDYQATTEEPLLVTGIVPVLEQQVEVLIAYLQQPEVARALLAVLHGSSRESKLFATTMERMSHEYNLRSVLFGGNDVGVPPSIPEGEDAVHFLRTFVLEQHIERIQLTGIQTIVLDLDARDMYIAADLLSKYGMLTSDYFYVLNERNVGLSRIDQVFPDKTENLVSLIDGALIVSKIDPSMILGSSDPFLTAWHAQGPAFKGRVDQILPRSSMNDTAVHAVPEDFFEASVPADFAAYVYDTVILTGLSRCAANISEPKLDEGMRLLAHAGIEANATRIDYNSSSSELIRTMRNITFGGASGLTSITDSGRRGNGYLVGAFNVRANATSIQAVLTSALLAGGVGDAGLLNGLNLTAGSGWSDVDGEKFQYRGGAEAAPATDRIVAEDNYLSKWIRILGLILMGIGWLLATACLGLVYFLRNDRAVRAAQPTFMMIICVGSFVLHTTIFTLSWDEGAGWTDEQLDTACVLSPWFFFVGHICTFLAIFTKLHRLDKVMQFRRTKVNAYQVLGPLIVFLCVTIALLITWTVVDPWQWNRNFISSEPPVTYGECSNDSWWTFFGPLMGLMILAEGLAFYVAYKTNQVPEEFRETAPVFNTIYIHLQGWAIGVPILTVIGTDSTDATYFGRVALVWMFGLSSVAVIVTPKVYLALRMRYDPRLQREANRAQVFVSGFAASGRPAFANSIASYNSGYEETDLHKSATRGADLPGRSSANSSSQVDIAEETAPPRITTAGRSRRLNSSSTRMPSISYLNYDNLDDSEA